MIITDKIKQRFLKDNDIRLNVLQDDVFLNRLELFNKKEEWEQFVLLLDKYPNEQAYFEYYNSVKDNAIKYIKSLPEYESFNSMNIQNINLPKIKNFYKDVNVGKEFISIDMRKSNFSVLKYFGVLKDDTYEDFIRRFTDDAHIINSKYIRQVIFGNCNPKRQITMANFLMSLLIKDYLTEFEIVYFDTDEIIIHNTNEETIMNALAKMNNEALWYALKIDKFTLGKIYGTDGYYKIRNNGKVNFYCVQPYELPFVYRAWKQEAFTEYDKKIMYDNKLATLDDYIFVAFETKLRD